MLTPIRTLAAKSTIVLGLAAMGLAATPFPVPKTKEEVAEYAQFIRQWLQTVAEEALTVGTAGA